MHTSSIAHAKKLILATDKEQGRITPMTNEIPPLSFTADADGHVAGKLTEDASTYVVELFAQHSQGEVGKKLRTAMVLELGDVEKREVQLCKNAFYAGCLVAYEAFQHADVTERLRVNTVLDMLYGSGEDTRVINSLDMGSAADWARYLSTWGHRAHLEMRDASNSLVQYYRIKTREAAVGRFANAGVALTLGRLDVSWHRARQEQIDLIATRTAESVRWNP